MAYFKIGNTDYSSYASGLKISTTTKYSALQNAAGNTVVDYINQKRKISVNIIALDDNMAAQILNAVHNFNVGISFLNPETKLLETDVECIIPSTDVEYYTIQANKVMLKAFSLTFTEL